MAENTGLTPAQKQVIAKKKTLADMFQKSGTRLDGALANTGITAKQMVGVAMTAINKTPKLLDCTPASVIQAVMLAAEAGLPVDGYHGHLIPYGTTCQFIPDFKGLIQLALQNDVIIDAAAVHDNDEFSYRLGMDPFLNHVPCDDEDRGPLKCAYAVARFGNGFRKFVVATRADVEKRRKASKSGTGKDSPWAQWEDEMWIKTSVKMLAKFIPRSARMVAALTSDDQADMGTQYQEPKESRSSIIADALQEHDIVEVESSEPVEPVAPVETPKAAEKPAAFSLKKFEKLVESCTTPEAVTELFDKQVRARKEEVDIDAYEKAYDMCKGKAQAIRASESAGPPAES
jgi:recombination protein RecT